MPASTRVYLDNAATTWPKPTAVYDAVDHYQRAIGASPARGVYAEACEANEILKDARARLARLLDGERPEHFVFTLNGSDALNLAIHGALRPGDHVVTSVVEHNSVLRPLRWLEQRGLIEVTRIACDGRGIVDPDDFRRALRQETRLVALVHASNVTGALQPVAEVGHIARAHGVLFLVDAAQSAGHVPISIRRMSIDLLAAPGHKGLLGPLGTGLLYIRPGIEDQIDPHRQGGTGTQSDEDRQPMVLPDKYEPGNVNALGVCGLDEGVRWVASQGVEALRRHAEQLTGRMLAGLADTPGVTLYGPRDPLAQVGVVSFTVAGLEPTEVAAILDSQYRVQVRAGIHCAPLMHQALGTVARGGTVRASLGPFTTAEEIDLALVAVREIAATSLAAAETA